MERNGTTISRSRCYVCWCAIKSEILGLWWLAKAPKPESRGIEPRSWTISGIWYMTSSFNSNLVHIHHDYIMHISGGPLLQKYGWQRPPQSWLPAGHMLCTLYLYTLFLSIITAIFQVDLGLASTRMYQFLILLRLLGEWSGGDNWSYNASQNITTNTQLFTGHMPFMSPWMLHREAWSQFEANLQQSRSQVVWSPVEQDWDWVRGLTTCEG